MRNKFIFLSIVLLLLFSMLFFINQNRSTRAILKSEENARITLDQIRRDSLQRAHINSIKSKNLNSQSSATTQAIPATQSTSSANSQISTPGKAENYSDYINPSIVNNSSNTNVSVTIVDEKGNIASPISSSIAHIYSQAGLNGVTGLLRSSFTHKSAFDELIDGNSDIIDKLKLVNYADYVAIGKIRYSFKKGTLQDGTIICNITLSMSIISSIQKTLSRSFSYSVIGNGVTDTQAKERAIQKLIDKYNSEYSSL